MAEKALADAELVSDITVHPFISIKNHFGFEPSPLQQWAERVVIDQSPQLFILEDVTGSGKTEAALALTHRLLETGAAEGFYFGLPTMATSNAMFKRIADYYATMLTQANGQPVSLVLAHAARDMHETFSALIKPKDVGLEEYAVGDDTISVQCNRWLADSRKKALLAPVGVGTIDQALLAVLPRKHQSLRVLGLSKKILIFDEVHAADTYMFELLEKLLTLQVHQGSSVILLTATLPQKTRERLINIWLRAINHEKYIPQSTAFPLATRVNFCSPHKRGCTASCHVYPDGKPLFPTLRSSGS